MSFDFYLPTRILFGKGKLNELSRQKLPGKKALIVTSSGPSMKKYGYLARLEEQLDKANVEHVLFDKILPNPIVKHVMEGAALAKESGCDFVIGLGGGSSIDSAKAIAVMATNEGHYWDYVSGGSGKGKPVPNDPLPIVAITTTAGTGTEADLGQSLPTARKRSDLAMKNLSHPVHRRPRVDDDGSAPFDCLSGFDALFHSTEGYLNITANEMSDLFALKAISLLGKSLPAAVADGSNEAARTDVALANTFAGIVEFTSGCISEHSIEHALSAFHPELPHGAGLIMISKAYYTFIAKSGTSDERMVEMAKALGKSDASDPMDFVDALHELQVQCGVDNLKMSDYGIKPEEFEDLAANALETMGGLFEVDPCKITHADIVQILRDSYR